MVDRHYLEAKMRSPFYLVCVNTILAILIFLGAALGGLLGINGLLSISVVWPPPGIALAAILLFGFRTWPGIFLGSLAYNLIQVWHAQEPVSFPILLAGMVSFGSLLEGLFAGYIMRHFSSPTYFKTVKDVFIFLIPAALIGSLIASTIGVFSLSLFGRMAWPTELTTWITFLIGDSMSLYILTPLIVVWSLQRPAVSFSQYPLEALALLIAFVTMGYLTFVEDYPIAQLLIPICVWVTFRFRMHGATLAIFLTTLAAIITASIGMGSFISVLQVSPIPIMISFFEVIVFTCLFFAAVLNERQEAFDVLKNHNLSLEEAYKSREEELKFKDGEIFVKDKLASLGLSVSNLAEHLEDPLRRLNEYIGVSLDAETRLKNLLAARHKLLDPEASYSAQDNLDSLEGYLHHMEKCNDQINRTVKVIKEQTKVISKEGVKAKPVNLNVLLNTCLGHVMDDNRNVEAIVVREMDKNLGMIVALPDDLIYAFAALFQNALTAMEVKSNKLGLAYKPILELTTLDHGNEVEIVIRDNGEGPSSEKLKNYLQSFILGESPNEPRSLKLYLAHDILTRHYQANIALGASKGEFFQVRILIPR